MCHFSRDQANPREDTGICIEVISYFCRGKIPIFGVCMGLQCMYECFGGKVGSAGEIVHGKTNIITHDGLGVYSDIPQHILETRYHSLSGDPATLPAEFIVTSWTESGCIMGIRHRTYTVEGVQYHPESILSEHAGMTMIRNFFVAKRWCLGGEPRLWGPVHHLPFIMVWLIILPNQKLIAQPRKKIFWPPSKINASRILLIQRQLLVDRWFNSEKLIELGIAPPPIDFPSRLRESIDTPGGKKLAVLAEIKRASPSKGDIFPDAIAAEQAQKYAEAGAATISILTEPKWFKGSLEDLRQAREIVNKIPNRPAILRKDFITDPYQILEARLAGADTVLLIVAMLTKKRLVDLLAFSRKYGMEPLVEVNNVDEMTIAISVGANVIGINNRNLHTFDVDMGTTVRLAQQVPKEELILVALSGVSKPNDVDIYKGTKVRSCAGRRSFNAYRW